MTEPGEPVEVLSGTSDGGLRWVVVTSGTDQDLYTMLNVYRGWSAAGRLRIRRPEAVSRLGDERVTRAAGRPVYGVSRDTPAAERMARQANWFSTHRDDRLLGG